MISLMHKSVGAANYPPELESWVGRSFLFKVETKQGGVAQFEDSYTVRRMTDSETLLTLFQLDGTNITPKKDMFTPPFSEIVDLTTDSTAAKTVFAKSLLNDFDEAGGCIGSTGDFSGGKATQLKRSCDSGSEAGSVAPADDVVKKVKVEKE